MQPRRSPRKGTRCGCRNYRTRFPFYPQHRRRHVHCTLRCPTNRHGVVLGDLARLKDLGHFRSCFSLRCEEWSFGPSDPIEEKWCEGASERAAGPNESNLSECDATGRKERERGARTNGRGLTCERFALLSSSFRLPLAVFFVAFPQGLESKQQKYVWRV